MKYSTRFQKSACALLGVMAGLLSGNAWSEEADSASAWTFPMSVSVVSDYVFRGQSQTWGQPAVQFSVEADHQSGFYAGFFASNVSGNWIPGANIETDYYAGLRGNLPGGATEIAFDVGAVYYVYPGSDWSKSNWAGFNASNKVDTLEVYLGLTYGWLNVKTGRVATEYFGWSTNNSPVGGGFNGDATAGVTGNTSGSYFYEANVNYEMQETWSLVGQLGQQVIANSTGLDITYYRVGVNKAIGDDWTVGLAYSGSNMPAAYRNFLSLKNNGSQSNVVERTAILSLSKAF